MARPQSFDEFVSDYNGHRRTRANLRPVTPVKAMGRAASEFEVEVVVPQEGTGEDEAYIGEDLTNQMVESAKKQKSGRQSAQRSSDDVQLIEEADEAEDEDSSADDSDAGSGSERFSKATDLLHPSPILPLPPPHGHHPIIRCQPVHVDMTV